MLFPDDIQHDESPKRSRKLEYYGTRGHALEWFSSWIIVCSMWDSLGQDLLLNSCPRTVGLRVPQGSLLGLLLFIIYINDFPKCLCAGWYVHYVQSILFADDSDIYFTHNSSNDLQKAVSSDLILLEKWFNAQLSKSLVIIRAMKSPFTWKIWRLYIIS